MTKEFAMRVFSYRTVELAVEARSHTGLHLLGIEAKLRGDVIGEAGGLGDGRATLLGETDWDAIADLRLCRLVGDGDGAFGAGTCNRGHRATFATLADEMFDVAALLRR
jgi:hypothetical protein